MAQRVLVADDSAVVRVTLSRRVRAAGLDVLERDSVASAKAVDARAIACALLDFDLGDGIGPDIASRLRSVVPDLPIAFFTSTTETIAFEQVAAFGPLFTKPGEIDAAIEWIVQVCRRT